MNSPIELSWRNQVCDGRTYRPMSAQLALLPREPDGAAVFSVMWLRTRGRVGAPRLKRTLHVNLLRGLLAVAIYEFGVSVSTTGPGYLWNLDALLRWDRRHSPLRIVWFVSHRTGRGRQGRWPRA